MKVVQVGGLAGPGPVAGGVWAVAETQSTILEARGYEVCLLGGWLGRPDKNKPSRKFLRLYKPFPGAGLRGIYNPKLSAFLRATASDGDVAHIHLARDFFTTFSLMWFKSKRIPIVVQPHGMIALSKSVLIQLFDLIFKRLYLTVPAKWLVLTNEERSALLQFGVDETRISAITNTVRTEGYAWSSPSVPEFVFVSRLHSRKQPEVFVSAAIRNLDAGRKANFRVAGPDQGMLVSLQRLIEGSGHGEHITVEGSLTPHETYKLLSTATALVLPSRGEVAPMIVLEAASIGTPIILTSDCGLSREFLSREAALVVEPEVDKVAEAIRRLIDDEDLGSRLSRRGRALFDDLWSEEAVLSVLQREYKSVATCHA